MRRIRLAGQLPEPIGTLVETGALAHPGALAEIEAIAMLHGQDGDHA
jgi:enamine deaminase RidA (YjgF/YER057c/UK114 family)